MYQRILLAYDGSLEGRAALREGALLALQCKAQVYLLSVADRGAAIFAAEGAHAGAVTEHESQLKAVLQEGAARLAEFGLPPVARLVVGNPIEEIRKFVAEVRADLVVVGHRRKSLLERWWSGGSQAYLIDQIDCSLLIARNVISDRQFREAMQAIGRVAPAIEAAPASNAAATP